jgi:inorganic pyrophosphatase
LLLALGYKSNIIPITLIAVATYISFTLCGMYGVALAALGMLSTLATCLSIDVYGPVCDNAGGIAEMSECPEYVREKTDALDAAGNTTAAIGKGFAIGSAALVALALFGAFVTRAELETTGINILQPMVFAWIFIGAMIPYWFTAMTMKSVGAAAMEMVAEVKRQFDTIPGLLEGAPGHAPPDHEKCIKISTDASLREMIAPGLLVILSPILCGTFFGVQAVSGLLTGSITSGVQLAISQSNTGGAWDNAKKYVERGEVYETNDDGSRNTLGKGSDVHKAAVIGDTVGDPLKDTSGPALNIVMKLQAIISLVFASFFMSLNGGKGLLGLPQN